MSKPQAAMFSCPERQLSETALVASARQRAKVVLFPGAETEPTDAALGRMQTRTLIEATVGELPSDLRLVFLMHEASGLSLHDIARDRSLPLGTVKTRLMRARHRRLRIITDRIRGGFETIFPFDGKRCVGMADRVVALLKARPHLS